MTLHLLLVAVGALAVPATAQEGGLEYESYLAHVAAAEGALSRGDVRALRRWLDAAPAAHRGFEWAWLDAQSDRSSRVLDPHGGASVQAIAYSPDGTRYATGAADGEAKLWDAESHAPLVALAAHTGGVYCVAWSADGRRLATSGADRSARVWDAASGEQLATFSGHGAPVTTVRFSPDGTRMASSSYTRPVGGEVRVWDASTGAELRYLQDGYAPITTCDWHPEGDRIAAASWDQHYRVFDLANPDEPLVTRLGSEDVYRAAQAAALSPDAQRIAVAGKDNLIHLFDAWTAEPLGDLAGHTKWVDGVAFSPDGARVASASTDGSVGLWNADTGKRVARLLGHTAGVRGIAFSPDGRTLLSGSADGTMRLWDLTRLAGNAGRIELDETPYHAVESPDGTVLAVGFATGRLELFGTSDGRSRRVLAESGGWINRVQFAADGARLLSAGEDGAALWDPASGERVAAFEANGLDAAELTPDGRAIAATGRDARGRVWDAETGELRFELEFLGNPRDVAVSPDGSEVTFVGPSYATRFSAWTGERLGALAGHEGDVRAVDYSPEGRHIATGGIDRTLRVWERASGRLLQTHVAHDQGILTVVYSPDGARLATGSSDQRLRLWDPARGAQVLSLDLENVYRVSWSANGDRLWVIPLLPYAIGLDTVHVRPR